MCHNYASLPSSLESGEKNAVLFRRVPSLCHNWPMEWVLSRRGKEEGRGRVWLFLSRFLSEQVQEWEFRTADEKLKFNPSVGIRKIHSTFILKNKHFKYPCIYILDPSAKKKERNLEVLGFPTSYMLKLKSHTMVSRYGRVLLGSNRWFVFQILCKLFDLCRKTSKFNITVVTS